MNKFFKIFLFILVIVTLTFILILNSFESRFQYLPNGTGLKLVIDEVFILSDASIYVFNTDDPFCKNMISYLREHPSTLPLALKKRCISNETT